MVRTGEYSMNNGSYLGPGCVFLGIGEYEEKKKYYDEKRKLECKQYLAQQAQKYSTVKVKNSTKKTVMVSTDTTVLSPPKIDALRNHAATQTFSLLKDASTNTEGNIELEKSELIQKGVSIKGNRLTPVRIQNETVIPRNITNDETTHLNGLSSFRTLSPGNTGTRVPSALKSEVLKSARDIVRGGILTDILNQNTNDIGGPELQTKNTRRRWIDNATSYAGDLHAQIEEKQKLKRELEEKEKQEELARDKWVLEDNERHKEELEKCKAQKNLDARRLGIDKATSYAGDLHAQLEEKHKLNIELEEKEKREKLARDKWVLEDNERHKEELEKCKARKNLRQETMEEFSRCQEQIRKDNEERRISETRQKRSASPNDTTDDDNGGIGNSSKEVDPVQSNQIPTRSSHKSFRKELMTSQGSDMFRNSYYVVAQADERQRLTPGKNTGGTQVTSGGSLTAREYQSKNTNRGVCKPVSARISKNISLPSEMPLPKSTSLADNLGKEERLCRSMEEKVPGNKGILSHLGEIRKQLEMEHVRMEKIARKQQVSNKNDL